MISKMKFPHVETKKILSLSTVFVHTMKVNGQTLYIASKSIPFATQFHTR